MKLRHSLTCVLLALGILPSANAFAADTLNRQGYYRAPALHDQTLVFTAEGDLWTQTLGQKAATRLTTLAAEELGAAISADGKWVAYVANYEGASEVYVIPVTGGVAKRLSFENSRVRVQGWTSQGEVLYSTDAGFGPANNWMLRLVNPESLTTTDLPLADAVEGVIDANHQYVYFTR
ncbi:MAG: S41 family peptidase, partial [Shewanella sp.]